MISVVMLLCSQAVMICLTLTEVVGESSAGVTDMKFESN